MEDLKMVLDAYIISSLDTAQCKNTSNIQYTETSCSNGTPDTFVLCCTQLEDRS